MMPTQIEGNSGTTYHYDRCKIDDFFDGAFETIPGNYMFASAYTNPQGQLRYKVLYIGETPDLSDCLSYRYQTMQEIDEKGITHIFIHLNENQQDRLNEAHDLIRRYIRFQPGRITSKWRAAMNILEEEMDVDELALQEQEDLYDFLCREGYRWESNRELFIKVDRIHPPTLDLELQVRACTPTSTSALRLRHGTENIFDLEKQLRQVLESVLTFSKRFSNTLDPPNSNDTYLYLYTDIEDTIETADEIVNLIKSSNLNLHLNQFHQRKERGNTNQPFIDLRFGFSPAVSLKELKLLRLARKTYDRS